VGGVFISDLSAESGAATLIEALDLYPGAQIEFLSRDQLDGEALQERLQRAAYLVLPQLSYDPMPRPLVEAFANGVPVIASSFEQVATRCCMALD